MKNIFMAAQINLFLLTCEMETKVNSYLDWDQNSLGVSCL